MNANMKTSRSRRWKIGQRGSVQLVMSNKIKSPHHAILTGELAWGPRSEVEEVKVKGRYFQDSARPLYSRRAASVERTGMDHPRKSKTSAMKERSSWSSRLKDEKA